jgi:hypothetical protein
VVGVAVVMFCDGPGQRAVYGADLVLMWPIMAVDNERRDGNLAAPGVDAACRLPRVDHGDRPSTTARLVDCPASHLDRILS